MELDKWTWRKVFKYLDFFDQHRFIAICRFLNENVFVIDLIGIPLREVDRLSDEILQYYPYCRKLNANDNPKIKDISHLPLKILYAKWSCGIADPLPPTLKKLYASDNPKIKDVFNLPLKILYAGGNCGITDKNLPPTLEELYADVNPKIKDVSHLPLKILYAKGDCGITDTDLPPTLEKLHAWNNPKIRDVYHLPNLKVFNCSKIE